MDRIEAVKLCTRMYAILQEEGYYPALTGGCLYKEGQRKDINIIIFRNRQQVGRTEMVHIIELLSRCMVVTEVKYDGWCTKCKINGRDVDILNQESEDELDGLRKFESIYNRYIRRH